VGPDGDRHRGPALEVAGGDDEPQAAARDGAPVLRDAVDHVGLADELGDEGGPRPLESSSAVPIWTTRPASSTATRSEMTMASAWSWVT